MTCRHPRAILGAAVGVFGAVTATAMFSSPAAHADDTTAILADITAVQTLASTEFTTAIADLGKGDLADGLTQLYLSIDNELFGVPTALEVGELDSLQGAAILPAVDFEFIQIPGPLTAAELAANPLEIAAPTATGFTAEANLVYVEGATTLLAILNGLPATDFAGTAFYNALSIIDQFILPGQIESIAGLAFSGL